MDGVGAVSPAGWGVAALRAAMEEAAAPPVQAMARPGWATPLAVRPVPPPAGHPAFLSHPRLRRTNALTQYVVAAGLEALGETAARVQSGAVRLGIIVGVMAGSVGYSRRFYEEVVRDPATASPLIFPETVFNAPASHLAAYLGSNVVSYTLVGDDGTFLQGLALAADWLAGDKVDGCLVIGAEESDWIVSDAIRLFHAEAIHGAGAGALLLKTDSGAYAELAAVTDSMPFTQRQSRAAAARRMRSQLPGGAEDELLCTSEQQLPRLDAAEREVWSDWPGRRMAPRMTLGNAFQASTAWQCVIACDALRRNECSGANVSVVGANQQAIGGRFSRSNGPRS